MPLAVRRARPAAGPARKGLATVGFGSPLSGLRESLVLGGWFEVPVRERFSATIGHADRDEYFADEIADVGPVAAAFSDDDPAEWFAGIGYRVLREWLFFEFGAALFWADGPLPSDRC